MPLACEDGRLDRPRAESKISFLTLWQLSMATYILTNTHTHLQRFTLSNVSPHTLYVPPEDIHSLILSATSALSAAPDSLPASLQICLEKSPKYNPLSKGRSRWK